MSEVIQEAGSPSEAVAQAEPVVETVENVQAEPVAQVEAAAEPQVDVRELQAQVEYANQRFDQLVEYIQSQGASPAQAQAAAAAQTGFDPSTLVDEYGNLDPQAFAGFLAQRDQQLLGHFDQRFQQIAAPLAAQEQEKVVAEGEQRLQDILTDDISRNGEFVTGVDEESKAADAEARKLVRTLADQAFPEIAQRYGMTPAAAERAISQAAGQVRSLLRAAGKTSVAQHVNHNATLAGARQEPAAGASGLVGMSDIPNDPSQIGADLVQKYAARNRAAGSLY